MEISISSRYLAAATKISSNATDDTCRFIGILPAFRANPEYQEKGAIVVACDKTVAFIGYDPDGCCILPVSYAPNKSMVSAFGRGKKDSVIKITEDTVHLPKASFPILNDEELFPGAPAYTSHIQNLLATYTIPSYQADPSVSRNFYTDTIATLLASIKAFRGIECWSMHQLQPKEVDQNGVFPPPNIIRCPDNASIMWLVASMGIPGGSAELEEEYATTEGIFNAALSHFTKPTEL